MDKTLDTEVAILTKALAATEPIGLRWTIEAREAGPRAQRGDARLRLRFGPNEAVYIAEVKRGLQPQNLGPILHHLAGHDDALLVADYVNPRLAETLRKHGIQFIDAAGNAYLARPPLFVFIQGQRPQGPLAETREPKGRAFQPTGLQVLFALLCKPDLANRPYREIAAHAGVAHGTVGWVMPELPRLGYVVEVGGRRRLTNVERLLKRWVEAYTNTLRPKLLLGRYQADRLNLPPDFNAARYGLLLGGEPAAAHLTGHLRPGTATFYGDKAEPALLIDLRLHLDPDGNVDFRRRFWNFEHDAGIVPPVLIYADLLAIGDARCLEAAKLINERYLARLY